MQSLVAIARFALPERLSHELLALDDEGFASAVIRGTGRYLPDDLAHMAETARRANLFLLAIPRVRSMFDRWELAMADWMHADIVVEEEASAYQQGIAETHELIEREMWEDVADECRELGLID
ncbi:hypothetical protein [Burkholderia sp. Nafp2/4-1b]|uniref:hypothetical protein n=1 Tax=Burkholderia sp. Nafp2/4-1b TaxID=2116686 RepID=UPI0013CED657|nr:hypothetical protein [Burkholderia sp. Nafp2/4-1b]